MSSVNVFLVYRLVVQSLSESPYSNFSLNYVNIKRKRMDSSNKLSTAL